MLFAPLANRPIEIDLSSFADFLRGVLRDDLPLLLTDDDTVPSPTWITLLTPSAAAAASVTIPLDVVEIELEFEISRGFLFDVDDDDDDDDDIDELLFLLLLFLLFVPIK